MVLTRAGSLYLQSRFYNSVILTKLLGIGELRLVNNTSNFSDTGGRLEISLNGEWGTICNVGFGASDATLACNQLGYRSASRYGTGGALG